MRKFWGWYDNGTYKVGCNGATVYVFDSGGRELAKFSDIQYAYAGAFHPKKNLFIAKSTVGMLAVYDLDKMRLVRKIVIGRLGGDDGGFAFTPDGEYFYNIECPSDSVRTRLTAYRTSDFEIEKIRFSDDEDMFLESIEFDDETNDCYVLGYMRNAEGIFHHGFIGRFSNGKITDKKNLNDKAHDYIRDYKDWQKQGFTEKSLEWSQLKNADKIKKISLKKAYLELR